MGLPHPRSPSRRSTAERSDPRSAAHGSARRPWPLLVPPRQTRPLTSGRDRGTSSGAREGAADRGSRCSRNCVSALRKELPTRGRSGRVAGCLLTHASRPDEPSTATASSACSAGGAGPALARRAITPERGRANPGRALALLAGSAVVGLRLRGISRKTKRFARLDELHVGAQGGSLRGGGSRLGHHDELVSGARVACVDAIYPLRERLPLASSMLALLSRRGRPGPEALERLPPPPRRAQRSSPSWGSSPAPALARARGGAILAAGSRGSRRPRRQPTPGRPAGCRAGCDPLWRAATSSSSRVLGAGLRRTHWPGRGRPLRDRRPRPAAARPGSRTRVASHRQGTRSPHPVGTRLGDGGRVAPCVLAVDPGACANAGADAGAARSRPTPKHGSACSETVTESLRAEGPRRATAVDRPSTTCQAGRRRLDRSAGSSSRRELPGERCLPLVPCTSDAPRTRAGLDELGRHATRENARALKAEPEPVLRARGHSRRAGGPSPTLLSL